MPAAPPGTVQLTATATDGSTATATAHYDPASLALADPFLTTAAATQLTFAITLADGSATHTWSIPPGSTLAAADLASVGVNAWGQIGSIAFTAA